MALSFNRNKCFRSVLLRWLFQELYKLRVKVVMETYAYVYTQTSVENSCIGELLYYWTLSSPALVDYYMYVFYSMTGKRETKWVLWELGYIARILNRYIKFIRSRLEE